MLRINTSVPADKERGWQSQNSSIEFTDLVVSHGHGVIHPEFFVEVADLADGIGTRVKRDADDAESLLTIFVLEFHEPRDLDAARAAPRSPEIQQDDLSFVVRQADLLAGNVGQGEVWRRGMIT